MLRRGIPLGASEGDLSGLEGDGSGGADVNTLAAVDTLVIAHMADVHGALGRTAAAAGTLGGFHFHAHHSDFGKQAVNRAQGTQEPAEGPVNEHTGQNNDQQDDKFPGKEDAQHGELIAVGGIGQQSNGALKGARRAYVLAERRNWIALHGVPKGNRKGKDGQNHVFQVAEHMGDTAFFDLKRGDLVHQLLQQPQGAQIAADGAAQGDAIKHQNAQHVHRRAAAGGGDGVLQRAQGTRPHGPGAGIAVKARHAYAFGLAGKDLSGDITLQIGVVKKGGIKLNQSALGGQMIPNPAGEPTQGRYTPYRY